MNKLILYADELSNPRIECDNLGTLVLRHYCADENTMCINTYMLGVLNLELNQVEKKSGFGFYTNQMTDYLFDLMQDKFVCLKVYKYEHGGITFSTTPFSCPWDSGLAGIIFVSTEKIRKQYEVLRATVKLRNTVANVLKLEVESYSNFANGNAVGFRIEDEDGDFVDGCGGFEMHDKWEEDVLAYIDNDLLGVTEEELLKLIKETEISIL